MNMPENPDPRESYLEANKLSLLRTYEKAEALTASQALSQIHIEYVGGEPIITETALPADMLPESPNDISTELDIWVRAERVKALNSVLALESILTIQNLAELRGGGKTPEQYPAELASAQLSDIDVHHTVVGDDEHYIDLIHVRAHEAKTGQTVGELTMKRFEGEIVESITMISKGPNMVDARYEISLAEEDDIYGDWSSVFDDNDSSWQLFCNITNANTQSESDVDDMLQLLRAHVRPDSSAYETERVIAVLRERFIGQFRSRQISNPQTDTLPTPDKLHEFEAMLDRL